MPRKQHGLGSIFQRTIKRADGTEYTTPTWYIQYCVNGVAHRESSHSVKYGDAEKLLKRRIAEAASGRFAGPSLERVAVGELLDDLLSDYKLHGKSVARFAHPIVELHLRPFFGQMRAARLTTDWLRRYIDSRQETGAANATINRELSLLRRAFNLARYATPPKVASTPRFELLPEATARRGFFEHEEYEKLLGALPEDERPLLTFAYYTGCRLGELLLLQWPQVELNSDGGFVRLAPDQTKSGEGRVIPLGQAGHPLYDTLVEQRRRREEFCPTGRWVFFRAKGGSPLRQIHHNWREACEATGISRLFHDLRRTGVRNLIRAGVPTKIAMQISGHKTDSVFRRYDIVDERDLQEAAVKLNEHLVKKANGK